MKQRVGYLRLSICLAITGLVALGVAACQSDVERLEGETVFQLENAISILEATAGNTENAIAALDKYLDEHRDRLIEVRSTATALLARMSPAEREKYGRKMLDRARPLRERIETLSRTFPDPPRILLKIREFM